VTGESATINVAMSSVSNTSSSIELFIYPGTYNEQLYINRTGPVTVRFLTDKLRSLSDITLHIYGFAIGTRTYE
jgi:pectin methylesterase-like acyl-CoA thioesterase